MIFGWSSLFIDSQPWSWPPLATTWVNVRVSMPRPQPSPIKSGDGRCSAGSDILVKLPQDSNVQPKLRTRDEKEIWGWEEQDKGTTEKQAPNPDGTALPNIPHLFCNKSKVGGVGEEEEESRAVVSKCVPHSSSMAWELVRNADSWAPCQTSWVRSSGGKVQTPVL